jgi:O-methyltransferase domain/Dimerisation domain
VNPLDLATAYQQSAVVAAACVTGVADAIAAGPRPPEAVAAACGTSPRATRALLGSLVALGLAARFGGELPALAGLAGPGRLLDVGGGAGSHAAALARAVPGLEATVLDLPAVEPVFRERHPELAFVPGDLDRPRFGRPRASAGTRSCWPTSSTTTRPPAVRRSWPPSPASSPPTAPCSSTSGSLTRPATPRPPSPCSTS